jgi:hypothetical protein
MILALSGHPESFSWYKNYVESTKSTPEFPVMALSKVDDIGGFVAIIRRY